MKFQIVILVIFLFILCGCSAQKNGSEMNQLNEKEISTSENNYNEISEDKQNNEISGNELPLKDVTKYLNMKKSEILEETSGVLSDDVDSISMIQSHLIFPYIFDDKLGLTFVFNNKIDNSNPIYLIVTSESNVRNINILGARPGMNFEQIKEVLGEIEVTKIWLGNEDNLAYSLSFKKDNKEFQFISYEENGENSILFIS